jgi:hypothetical protein
MNSLLSELLSAFLYFVCGFLTALILTGCGQDEGTFHGGGNGRPPLDYVTRARAEIEISIGPDRQIRFANPTSVPVSYVYAASATMTVDAAQLVPALSGDTLDLGQVSITEIKDNNLKVCGGGENTRCTQALVLIYTTGTASAGMYNSVDGYGVPIAAGLVAANAVVGLARANAAIVQTHAIQGNKNQFREEDFSAAPVYQIESDFSNAGAGSYSTVLVIEYGLSL